MKVDLNADVGESFGRYTLGMDDHLIPLLSSANIACGYHAGDPLVMEKTVELCKNAGVALGVHPGFPDLQGFGGKKYGLHTQGIKDHAALSDGSPGSIFT